MAKVKSEYNTLFLSEDGEEVRIIVQWDVSDDEEGYGVVIGDENTNETISFGQGDLAYFLSSKLFSAVINELNSKGESMPKGFRFDDLKTLYDSKERKALVDIESFNNLSKIVEYINIWY